ncbi:MAG TPA: polysaccharide deacetylase family protein [Saprospiraceae bacterium]|nr:polysaccharide deacetylase family protein [Saprospiraceae bacterium]HPN68958.1 polysaccharide deacetylase family protein [Saprospiraceae bacterium]
MYFVKTPALFKWFYKQIVWDIPSDEKVIYLTFDDGPIPDITQWVLEILKEYNAEATFFCVGENVKKYPEIFSEIKQNGHAVGNHTFHHISGWKTAKNAYIENVDRAAELIESNLFRPPYGKMTPAQMRELGKKYRLIYWDVLSGDFDKSVDYKTCLKKLKKHTKSGSIVVFHDSIKSEKVLRMVLPEIMDYWQTNGFIFKKIASN